MAKYYYGSTRMNDNSLSHAGYKYKDKYKNKYGNWVYVYEDENGKTTERDQAHYQNELSNQRAAHKGEPSFGQPANKSTQASTITQGVNKVKLKRYQDAAEYKKANQFRVDHQLQKIEDERNQKKKNQINAMGDALTAKRKEELSSQTAKYKTDMAKLYEDAMAYNAKQADIKKKNAQDKLAQLEKERQAHAGEVIGDDRGTAAAQARDKQNAAKAMLLKLAKEREAHAGEVIGDDRYTASGQARTKENAAKTAASRIASEKANYEEQKQIQQLRNIRKDPQAAREEEIKNSIDTVKNDMIRKRREAEAVSKGTLSQLKRQSEIRESMDRIKQRAEEEDAKNRNKKKKKWPF